MDEDNTFKPTSFPGFISARFEATCFWWIAAEIT